MGKDSERDDAEIDDIVYSAIDSPEDVEGETVFGSQPRKDGEMTIQESDT